MASHIGERVALARVKEQLGGLRAQTPERAGALNPRAGVRAFKATRSAQGNRRIKRSDVDADLLVGGCGEALGRGDVGTPLEQLRGHANRHLRERQIKRRRRNAEGRQAVVSESANGVLVLRARHTQVDKLRAHGLKQRLRLRDVHPGGHAASKTPLRQVELALEVGHGVGKELDLGIEAAESEIVGGHLRMERESHVGLIGGAGLCVLARLLHSAANAAPEVRLPTGLASNGEVAVGGGAARRSQRTMR